MCMILFVELFFSKSDKAIKRHEKYIKNKHLLKKYEWSSLQNMGIESISSHKNLTLILLSFKIVLCKTVTDLYVTITGILVSIFYGNQYQLTLTLFLPVEGHMGYLRNEFSETLGNWLNPSYALIHDKVLIMDQYQYRNTWHSLIYR